jgi:trans-aconitate 2-methyltransferase
MFRYLFITLLSLNLCLRSLAASQGVTLANDYQNNSNFQWEQAMESLKKFPFNENDKVLDVGCGNGKITALIAKKIPYGIVIGLDISQEMLLHAVSNFSAENLLFLQGDAKSIPFKQQFDKLVCFYTLNWVIEQEQALQCFKDSLKPGGSLLLIVPGKAPSNLGPIVEKIIRSEKWSSYFPDYKQDRIYFTPEEYLSLLEKIQFQVQSLEVCEVITRYKDKTALIAHARPVLNMIDHLSPALQGEFIEDFLIAQGHETFSDGSIEVRNVKIEVIAFSPKNDYNYP